jgi:hypothetical protein
LPVSTRSTIAPPQTGAASDPGIATISKTQRTRSRRSGEPVESIVVKAAPGATFEDLWMRAIVLAPDLQNFMSATFLGTSDTKELRVLMRKPSSALAMTFSNDPLLVSDRFSGEAVVFLSTVNFTTRTAFLQQ